jgi:hypothetical protein
VQFAYEKLGYELAFLSVCIEFKKSLNTKEMEGVVYLRVGRLAANYILG